MFQEQVNHHQKETVLLFTQKKNIFLIFLSISIALITIYNLKNFLKKNKDNIKLNLNRENFDSQQYLDNCILFPIILHAECLVGHKEQLEEIRPKIKSLSDKKLISSDIYNQLINCKTPEDFIDFKAKAFSKQKEYFQELHEDMDLVLYIILVDKMMVLLQKPEDRQMWKDVNIEDYKKHLHEKCNLPKEIYDQIINCKTADGCIALKKKFESRGRQLEELSIIKTCMGYNNNQKAISFRIKESQSYYIPNFKIPQEFYDELLRCKEKADYEKLKKIVENKPFE